MASNVLRQLRLDLGKVEAEIARLAKQAESLHGAIAFYEEQGDTHEVEQPAKGVRNAAVELLAVVGAPLHYREVYKRLKEAGVTVKGQDPASNVLAHMSSDDRFVNVGRGIWGLRRWGEPLRTEGPMRPSGGPTIGMAAEERQPEPNTALESFGSTVESAKPDERQLPKVESFVHQLRRAI